MPRWLKVILTVVVLTLITTAVAGPLGPVPGIRLGGTPSPAPAQWSDIVLPHNVQLRTTGGLLPRVVNIWVVESDNTLFIVGEKGSGWVNGTLNEPQVDLRIGDNRYPLVATAQETVDLHVYQKYIDRYRADYPDIIAGMPKAEEVGDAAVIFRLNRR